LYPLFIIIGKLISPIVTTVAPTIPVQRLILEVIVLEFC